MDGFLLLSLLLLLLLLLLSPLLICFSARQIVEKNLKPKPNTISQSTRWELPKDKVQGTLATLSNKVAAVMQQI